MVYIYGLIDPRDNKIKYVGKTVDLHERLMQHLRDFRGCTKKINWVKHLVANGLKPEVVSLEVCTEETWEAREKWWIASLEQMGAVLKNGTAGGDGCSYWTGKKRRPSVMAKIGLQNRGENSGMSKFTEEQILDMVSMYKNGAPYKEIQERHGISESNLGSVLTGRTWAHLGIKITEEDRKLRKQKQARGNAKLAIEQIKKIRSLYKLSSYSQQHIADMFGVSRGCVAGIVTYKTWRHI